ncbi:MAG: heme o synthase [Planctomycetota bacterium]|nr:heme o synthase [Planctomycetota bacterium]
MTRLVASDTIAHRHPVRVDAAALIEAAKPGITRLVTLTAAWGFVLPALQRSWTLKELLLQFGLTICGTALSAAGANAINQWMEAPRDARMERTRRRPIPSGRADPATVLWFGVFCCAAGSTLLLGAGLAPALVSLACILSYLLVYTPLKPRTSLATFVGAIPGGLPPLIGYTAASGGELASAYHPLALALLAIMLLWQLPHFLAIAWLYRDDYARGGYAVLPVLETDFRVTAASMLLWAVALVPATLFPLLVAPDLLGAPYAVIAAATGAAYVLLCARLTRSRKREHARVVFFASIVHLPILILAMCVESALRALL